MGARTNWRGSTAAAAGEGPKDAPLAALEAPTPTPAALALTAGHLLPLRGLPGPGRAQLRSLCHRPGQFALRLPCYEGWLHGPPSAQLCGRCDDVLRFGGALALPAALPAALAAAAKPATLAAEAPTAHPATTAAEITAQAPDASTTGLAALVTA